MWSVPGVTTTYQWRRNGSAIAGATGTTFVVRAEDVGASLTVVATGASAEFGTGTSTSAAVVGKAAAGPVATSAPEISGSGRVGTTLTSTSPTWDLAGTTTTLQWLRNGTVVSGATSSTYDVVAGDLNASITLRATGTLPGRSPTVVPEQRHHRCRGNRRHRDDRAVHRGRAKVGMVLTEHASDVEPGGGTADRSSGSAAASRSPARPRRPTWCVPMTSTPTISVRYTGTLPGRAHATVASSPRTGLLGDAPQATTAPVVTGTRKVGTVLSTSTPAWNLTGVQQTVEWLRNGQPISGQTTSTYTVRPEDVDASLAVRYTGTLPGRAVGTTDEHRRRRAAR